MVEILTYADGGGQVYAQDGEGNDGVWKTVRGRKVFIRDGESLGKALERSLKQPQKPGRYLSLKDADRVWAAHGKTWDTNKPAATAAQRDVSELSEQNKAALTAFSGDRFKDINSVLRKGVGARKDTHSLIKSMDTAFSRIKPLSTDVLVYRGGFVEQKVWSKFLDGKGGNFYLNDPGFKATTVSESVAANFLNDRLYGATSSARLSVDKVRIRMEILVPKGTKAIPMVKLAENAKEQELLLDRKSKIRILAIDKKKEGLYKVTGVVE